MLRIIYNTSIICVNEEISMKTIIYGIKANKEHVIHEIMTNCISLRFCNKSVSVSWTSFLDDNISFNLYPSLNEDKVGKLSVTVRKIKKKMEITNKIIKFWKQRAKVILYQIEYFGNILWFIYCVF